jgi:hypothetical protein
MMLNAQAIVSIEPRSDARNGNDYLQVNLSGRASRAVLRELRGRGLTLAHAPSDENSCWQSDCIAPPTVHIRIQLWAFVRLLHHSIDAGRGSRKPRNGARTR